VDAFSLSALMRIDARPEFFASREDSARRSARAGRARRTRETLPSPSESLARKP
jgi:hypothetical protein